MGGLGVQRDRARPEAGVTGNVRAPRIAILAHVGNENLGDEAIVAAVVRNLRRRSPEAELLAFTTRPADTTRRHGIPAHPVRPGGAALPVIGTSDRAREPATATLAQRVKRLARRVPGAVPTVRAVRRAARLVAAAAAQAPFLLSSYRLLKGTDLLLVAGSAQLMDYWGGPWSFPFALFRWSLLARLCGARVAFASIGAGPLTTRSGKVLIRRSVMWADYCSYRDESSRELIRSLGVPGEHLLVPDLAFTLDPPPPEPPRPHNKLIVGINPMPLYDGAYWPETNRPAYERYVETLAGFADWLLEQGHVVAFFPTQLRVDPGAIRDVRVRMRRASGDAALLADRPIRSLDELLAELQHVDLVVATRFHGIVFALLLSKPVLGIAYQPKSRDLMRLAGQDAYLIRFDELDLTGLQERFLALVRDRERVARVMEQCVGEAREMVNRQYDQLLALATARAAPRPRTVPTPKAARALRGRTSA